MDLTYEECAEVLQDLSERYFSEEESIDTNFIELEEI
jgi:hypothetical protein